MSGLSGKRQAVVSKTSDDVESRNGMIKNPEPLITGERIYLRKLSRLEISKDYLAWLNDEEVQNYTRRRGKKTSQRDMEEFVEYAQKCSDYHMAIRLNDSDRHIGNISLNNLDTKNLTAELSIMLGDKSVWGKGFAKEAIKLATKYGFEQLKLNRLWAESPNPAFNKAIASLGWTKDGIRQKSFFV